VASREGRRALRSGEARARVERTPGPLALTCSVRPLVRLVQRLAREDFVAARERERSPDDPGERLVLPEASLAEALAQRVELAAERGRVQRAAGLGRARAEAGEDPLETGLGRVEGPGDSLVGFGAEVVEPRGAIDLAHAGRELCLQAEQLRASVRREL